MAKATLAIASKNYGSWSLRGWLLCKMAGLEFDEVMASSDDPSTRAELLLLSPSFLVPRLTHDGVKIWDTLAIAEYLSELKPGAGLLPKDQAARARCRSISGEMHSGFSNLRSALPMNLKAHYPGFKIWLGAQADIDRITAIWRECLAESDGPFLFGKKPCVADAMFAPVCTRFAHLRRQARRRLRRLLQDNHGDAAHAGMDRGSQDRARGAGRTRRRVLVRSVRQSSLAPERATTSFHFAVSLAMVSAKSFGVPPADSSPIWLNRSLKPGDRIARLTASLSFSRMAGGIPAGPISPVQVGAL